MAPDNYSKLGGLPLAGSSFAYPKDSQGRSQHFIGQLDLTAMKRELESARQFPGDGILYFFGTLSLENDVLFIMDVSASYSPERTNLRPQPLPEDLRDYGPFAELSVRFEDVINIPHIDSSLLPLDELDEDEMRTYKFYEHLLHSIQSPGNELGFLGHAYGTQDCPMMETILKREKASPFWNRELKSYPEANQMKAMLPRARQWRLLFHLEVPGQNYGSLPHFGGKYMEYAQAGYYLMIRQEDLDQLRFDNTEMIPSVD